MTTGIGHDDGLGWALRFGWRRGSQRRRGLRGFSHEDWTGVGLRGLRQRFHTERLLSPFRFGNRAHGRDIIGRRRARRAQSVSVRRLSWRGGLVL